MNTVIRTCFVHLSTDHPSGANNIKDVVAMEMERQFGSLSYRCHEVVARRVYRGELDSAKREYAGKIPVARPTVGVVIFHSPEQDAEAQEASGYLRSRFPDIDTPER